MCHERHAVAMLYAVFCDVSVASASHTFFFRQTIRGSADNTFFLIL